MAVIDEWRVEVATEKDLPEIKIVDDAAFGSHHGITYQELKKILECGCIVVLRHPITDKIIGQSQLVWKSIQELPYALEWPAGWCYGTGILPQYQGNGLGKILAREREKIARQKGLRQLLMTIRVENYASLRLYHGEGFRSFVYQHDFYGNNPAEDARLLLRKDLLAPKIFSPPSDITVPIQFDGKYDKKTHAKIHYLFLQRYEGVWVDKHGMHFLQP